MRARFIAMLLVIVSLGSSASGVTLTFDDLDAGVPDPNHPIPSGPIPNGYGGLDWERMWLLDGSNIPESGYNNGRVSGNNVAFNAFPLPAAVTSDGVFDFHSTYLTAAWNTGLSVRVQGYLGVDLLYDNTVIVDTTGPTLFNFDYLGIDQLTFASSGGVDADAYDQGSGEQFAMDNFTYVPEPVTMLLLGIGLSALAALRLRRSRT